MVLLNTHPDYMAMEGSPHGQFEFPVKHYEELLQYVNSTYPGQFWHALPHEVASLVQARETTRRHQRPGGASPVPSRHGMKRKPKIWIDLDNTPHVPFFEPIMEELESRGYPLLVTARDAFQVCELADKKGLPYFKVGRHHGKNKFRKATGLMHRASQLASLVLREGPLLGVSHGSRSQLMLSNLLRIPTLLIEDYEYCQFPFMMKPSWILAPDIIPGEVLPVRPDRVRHYSGIKEDVYAWKLVPDPSLRLELGLAPDDLVVTVRPPATEAHYHNPESEILFAAFMDRACRTPGVRVILLPRNQRQRLALEKEKPEWFRENRTVVPQGAVDGMNLIWQSDLVVSGGGTMNREAAALGVPVFSLFRGNLGAVDRQLNLEGRLGLITSLADVDRIPVVKRQVKPVTEVTSRSTLMQIVDTIEEIAAFHLASR
jgi:predicted glycosyltransferase